MTILFDFPYILLLIPLILIVWWVFLRETNGYRLPNALMKRYLTFPWIVVVLWVTRVLIVTISIGILAGPHVTRLVREPSDESSHTIIILDISRSMLATDIIPDRITAAKDTIHTFLTWKKSENIWLMLFAGKPFLSVPFTTDYTWLGSIIDNISPYSIRQEYPGLSWTAIGDALLLGVASFSGMASNGKNIILLTDGRANIGIDPRKVLPQVIEGWIHVFTVWIGTLTGWAIPGWGAYEASGGTWLDESLLSDIARDTGGQYFGVTDAGKLSESLQIIDTLTALPEGKNILEKRYDYRLELAILLTLLIFAEYLQRRSIMRRYHLI